MSSQKVLDRLVFISSTFNDMHAERGLLGEIVFKRLQQRLDDEKHRLKVKHVDLRWGVDTDNDELRREIGEDDPERLAAAKELLVLASCLREIDSARPFMVVLLGDRYGWRAPLQRMREVADERGLKVDDERLREMSVTALEIEYGILRPEQTNLDGCRFYFRNLDMEDMTDEQRMAHSDAERARLHPDPEVRQAAAEDAARLQALKDRIRTLAPGRVRDYDAEWDDDDDGIAGLDRWVDQIVEDVWEDLKEEVRRIFWEADERAEIESFTLERVDTFLGREPLCDELFARLTGDGDGPAVSCIVGEGGIGKSSVFSSLWRRLDPTHSPVLRLGFAAGINRRATRVEDLQRRWITELEDALSLSPEQRLTAEADPDEVDAALRVLLTRVGQQKRVVLLVDALDQMERIIEALRVSWLPSPLPPNVRVLLTTLPGPEADALAEREDAASHRLGPIDEATARRVVVERCLPIGKHVNSRVLDNLISIRRDDDTPAHGNPLWLSMAVTELLSLGEAKFREALEDPSFGTTGEERHFEMLRRAADLPPTVEELCDVMLARVEGTRKGDRNVSRAVLRLLAASRLGWRRSDLLGDAVNGGLLRATLEKEPKDLDRRFADFVTRMGRHLVRRGADARYDFHHRLVREGAVRHYLRDADDSATLHRTIAEHLVTRPEGDPLRISESMHHYLETGDQTAAARYYARRLYPSSELDGATAVLAERIIAAELTDGPQRLSQEVAGLLTADDLTSDERHWTGAKFHFCLLAQIKHQATSATQLEFSAAVERGHRELSASAPDNLPYQRQWSNNLNGLGDILVTRGDLSAAEQSYRDALRIAQRLADSAPDNIDWQRDVAVSLNKLGDVLDARGDSTGSEQSYRDAMLITRRLADSDPDNAGRQRDLAVSLSRLGNALVTRGEFPAAEEHYRDALLITRRLADSDPDNTERQRDLTVFLNDLGNIDLERANFTAAEQHYREALLISRRLVDSDPDNTEWQSDHAGYLRKVGDVLVPRGEFSVAEQRYNDALRITRRLADSDPGNTSWQSTLAASMEKLGDVRAAKGDLISAEQSYEEALLITRRLADSDPDNAKWQNNLTTYLTKLGDAHTARADFPAAEQRYSAAMRIRRQLVDSDPNNALVQHDLVVSISKCGDALVALGDLPAAERSHRDALRIAQGLADSSPDTIRWQKLLAACLSKVGDVLVARGNHAEAEQSFRDAVLLCERQAAADSDNADWQGLIAAYQMKVASLNHLPLADRITSMQAAVERFRRLTELTPQSADAWNALIGVLFQLGQYFNESGDQQALVQCLFECHYIRRVMEKNGMQLRPELQKMFALIASVTGDDSEPPSP